MINCDQQKLEQLADKLIIDIKKDPFSYKNDIKVENYTEEDFSLFETILMTKMPNLVITHRDTDTSEDLSNQLKRIKDIYLNNMQPYFIDFSKQFCKIKKR